MAVHPFASATQICELGGWRVTNLELQKILYIAHMVHMGENNGARLINGSFEAWDYGPVEPNIYHKVKIFGGNPIQDIFFAHPPIEMSAEWNTIVNAAKFLLGKRPGELVAITHWEKGAWAKNYVSGIKGIAIPDSDIIAEYNARVAA